jgi:adenylyl- and sulfurtransferase ThiI
MTEDTIVVVYPSLFAENKIDYLIENIKKILKIKNLKYTKITKDDFLICIQADDPVFVSSAVALLFGIKQIVIAKKIKNDFKTIVSEVGQVGTNLLLKGEKFFVRAEGNAKGFVIKDLELAATSVLIQKNQKISARPGTESKHDKLLQIYVTKSNAYVCIFVDDGLGGTANNSQLQKSVCCITDEFSALNCLETIKQGFEIRLLICYETREHLIHLVKILDKILPRMLRLEVEIEFHKIPKFGKNSQELLEKNSLVTDILIKSAKEKKITHIALATSPLIFPSKYVEMLQKRIFSAEIIPHISLSGIDSEIIKNAKEIGLEKYLSKIEKFAKTRFTKSKPKQKRKEKTIKKTVKVRLGPNNVHTILDSLEIEH